VLNVQDLVISIKLWAKGYVFFTPTRVVAYHRPTPIPRSFVFNERDAEQYQRKIKFMQDGMTYFKSFLMTSSEAEAFGKYHGIDYSGRSGIPRNLALGITPADEPDDILLKERVLLVGDGQ
jgi:hypothetical protein